eukprot:3240559-Rhodomonas_salina.3
MQQSEEVRHCSLSTPGRSIAEVRAEHRTAYGSSAVGCFRKDNFAHQAPIDPLRSMMKMISRSRSLPTFAKTTGGSVPDLAGPKRSGATRPDYLEPDRHA